MKRKHKVRCTFKGDWMKREDWLNLEVDWNDLIVIFLKPLPPKKRPYDWIYSGVQISKGTGKNFRKDIILECLKAIDDLEVEA